jgi:hypothetical protein
MRLPLGPELGIWTGQDERELIAGDSRQEAIGAGELLEAPGHLLDH